MSIASFVHQAPSQRVVFGAGTLDTLPAEVERLHLSRVLVLSTRGHEASAVDLARRLGPAAAAVFAQARMHTPVATTELAVADVARHRCDGIVAVGGGSTIGLGKAIAMRTDLPQIAVPTTYAGSEATNILGETIDGRKKTIRHGRVLPEVVVYDVDLTMSLPVGLSIASGLNAIAHGVEALYAKDGNPVVSLLAEEAIKALSAALSVIAGTPGDRAARADALYGSWLSGMVLGSTSMALHHKLCHVLGGTFDLPHAATHAILLPHVVAFNGPAAPDAMARVSRALDTSAPAAALFALTTSGGGPGALRELGMAAADLDRAADLASLAPYWNPRPFSRDEIRALLEDAWRGVEPRVAA